MKLSPGALMCVSGMIMVAPSCSNPPPRSESRVELHSDGTLSFPASRGFVEGKVLFEGSTVPQSTRIENTTDPEHCGTPQSLRDIIISKENRGIENVIVALNGVVLPEGYRPGASRLVLDNRDCEFQPHVAVLTTGSSVEATNSDPFFHSVHFYGFLNRNLALAPNQSKLVRTLNRPGYYIIKCDVHGWMQAFFRVDRHPFHAVTGSDGVFRITNVPPGSYTLETWHERFGKKEIKVAVKPETPSRVTIYYRNESS